MSVTRTPIPVIRQLKVSFVYLYIGFITDITPPPTNEPPTNESYP